MGSRTYRIRGTAIDYEDLPTTSEITIKRHRRLILGRARDGVADELDVASDEVVRVELNNGFVHWLRCDDLVREYGRHTVSRDGVDVWEFGALAPPLTGSDSRDKRGLLGLAIKLLDFFGCDIEKRAARRLGGVAEKKLLKGQAPGFYRCSLADEFSLKPVGRRATIPVDKGPILVFIHGTASSCRGSFGKLWEPDNQSGREARKRLEERYGDRVFAFEHLTLTESPITNALELAGRLPKGGEIHLVSHSRGGMVGELLCLSGCENLAAILTPQKLKTLFAADRTIAEQLALSPLDQQDLQDRNSAYEKDRKALQRLVRLLNGRFAVKRFVRVACPARGTTLASGRLDRWLSMLSFLLQKVTGEGLFGDGVDFLFSVVKERTDPRVLPGLEAMMPGSALTRLLQHPDLVTQSDLSVIAGDLDGSALLERLSLKRLVADWFYSADNDLVVNTGSMSGGLKRPPKGARYLKDQGAQVDHFSYFGNHQSVEWLVAGLIRADDDSGGFHPFEAAQKERPIWRDAVAASRSGAAPRPLALVLPGTMGSQLKAGDDLVWLDYWSLFRGGLKKIAMGSGHRVSTTDEVIGEYYGPLLEFLARTHRLEVVAYDWRLSVLDAADSLMERLETCLPRAERERQPVHLVAHSMGGLVVRAMIADRQRGHALWQRIIRLPNSRFLMLGTPNRGSYEALRWLTGTNPTQAKLSLLDMTQSTDHIVDLVREFPGLLELLPIAEEPKLAGQSPWRVIKQTTRAGWKPAKATALRRAAETWELLQNAPRLDPRFACYVAGSQPATVIGYRFSEYDESWLIGRKRLDFLASAAGDGTVSWSSGKLPDLPVWYLEDTAHDALCTQQRAFAGYLDILMTGTTTRLSDTAPVVAHRGAQAGESFVLPPLPPVDSIPAPAELSGLTFSGNAPVSAGEGRAVAPTIKVSVRHGNLAYARHPVLVGHYLGDTIVSAEASLNRHLNGALERRLDLELYPGFLNSHALFFNENPRGKPSGAIVVGLGQVGELTPGLLRAGVAAALLDYALQVADRSDDRFGNLGAPRRASVTCLLVGTGAGGIQVCDSLEAILRGAVEANLRLVKANMDSEVTIDRLEFLELYEDVAIASAESLRGLLMDGELAAAIRWPVRVVESGQAGQRRVRHDEPPEWWHRLEIFAEKERPDLLRFSFSTDRARVEETLSRGQLNLADAFVESASASTGSNTEVARTLFEMLLPLRLKESAPRQDNLVLMVDERSARYPWELLEDRWSNDARPPSVRAGMVRQLKTPDFRSRPAHAVEAKALVVGNPNLGGCEEFSNLPGARSEAGKVVELLRERKFQVEECIDGNHGEIIHSLHKEAWRILHLAGHGVHEYLLPDASEASPETGRDSALPRQSGLRRSGMVIGCGKILTPGDVEQMRWVPELVFINCCHLGKGGDRQGLQRGPLAANLGMHFIRMGVRAVVAAGWAVDDKAALIFAESFYRHMLDGDEFGEAVRAAREDTWLRMPGSNTWGAYQCYGDQGYRLHKDGRGPVRRVRSFSAPIELETELNNLACALRVGETGLEAVVEERVSQLLDRCPISQRESWLGRADVAAALGFVWGEARRWPAAVETLEKALQANGGDCPIRAVEQCANYKVRSAAEACLALSRGRAAEREAKRQECIRIIESSILEMDLLCQRAETVERLSLLGSACKRLAVVQDEREQRKAALLKMACYYRRALEMGGGGDPYPFTNWACAQLLLCRLDPALTKFDSDTLLHDAERIEKQLAVSNENDPNFWDSASMADIALVRLLVRCDGQRKISPECESLVSLVIATYGDAIARGASPREIASLIEHLDFLELMHEPRTPLSKAIRQIKGTVARYVKSKRAG